jgi:hypothetical protein
MVDVPMVYTQSLDMRILSSDWKLGGSLPHQNLFSFPAAHETAVHERDSLFHNPGDAELFDQFSILM